MQIHPSIVNAIIDLELALEAIAEIPASIFINEKVTEEISITALWFDEHDGSHVIGVSYTDKSAKNANTNKIFKAITVGVPRGIANKALMYIDKLVVKILKTSHHLSPYSAKANTAINLAIDMAQKFAKNEDTDVEG